MLNIDVRIQKSRGAEGSPAFADQRVIKLLTIVRSSIHRAMTMRFSGTLLQKAGVFRA